MKNLINKTLIRTTGHHINKYESKKDKIFNTQRKLCNSKKRPIIFDIGAYDGETALTYSKYFNQCDIFSFEPYKETYDVLEKNIKAYNNIKSFNIALGNNNGKSVFHVNNFLATNSLLPSSDEGINIWGADKLETKKIIEVPMQTIDHFLQEEGINQIDILKMDAQGAEYLILEGAKESIAAGKIKIIYSELIVRPIYEGQKDLDEMLRIYRNLGFDLYNLYKSNDKDDRLKFMDGIFIFKG